MAKAYACDMECGKNAVVSVTIFGAAETTFLCESCLLLLAQQANGITPFEGAPDPDAPKKRSRKTKPAPRPEPATETSEDAWEYSEPDGQAAGGATVAENDAEAADVDR